jgi:hypothetical protein
MLTLSPTANVAVRHLWLGALALSLFVASTPASAQWTPVPEVPTSDVFAVFANGDTVAASADSTVYISTNAGATWRRSAKLAPAVGIIPAIRVRNGHVYAGTGAQGVFISDDLGTSWRGFNEGLVGGLFNSQLHTSALEVRGDSLYVATLGAGIYVRSLIGAGGWSHFGEQLEPNQASNVNAIGLGGGNRLVAAGGANGTVFFRDPGAADWTVSSLDNVGLHPGVQGQSVEWTGSGWVVGTLSGVFRSVAGQEPWSRTDPGVGQLLNTAFVPNGGRLFAAFVHVPNVVETVFELSTDNGASWTELERFANVFTYRLAMVGDVLYAGRNDGLWRRSIATASVPPGDTPSRLRFALAGPQPVLDQAHLRFDLPEAGPVAIEVFDMRGARAIERLEAWRSAGPQEVSLNARRLRPGVYAARLTAAGRSEIVRLVHVQ